MYKNTERKYIGKEHSFPRKFKVSCEICCSAAEMSRAT